MLNSSCIQTVYLPKNKVKVPKDINFFKEKYKTKYNVISPTDIDTSVMYKEIFYINQENEVFIHTDHDSFLKFYPNGNVNYFSKQKGLEMEFNPFETGYRGVTYFSTKKNKQIISLVEPVTGLLTYGVRDYYASVKNDTLLIKRRGDIFTHIYVPYKVTESNNTYITQW